MKRVALSEDWVVAISRSFLQVVPQSGVFL
jgi:hypothetical protein